jgi:hypothetical protein
MIRKIVSGMRPACQWTFHLLLQILNPLRLGQRIGPAPAHGGLAGIGRAEDLGLPRSWCNCSVFEG